MKPLIPAKYSRILWAKYELELSGETDDFHSKFELKDLCMDLELVG